MIKAIYPGTFDPITYGHLDIIKRASKVFDKLVVAVAEITGKEPLFSYLERIDLTEKVVAREKIRNVEVKGFSSLVVEFALKEKAKVIVRGLRMLSDFEYEFQMALTNFTLCSKIETVFFMPNPNYAFFSSRLLKEIFKLGANLEKFLPPLVIEELKKKTNEVSGR